MVAINVQKGISGSLQMTGAAGLGKSRYLDSLGKYFLVTDLGATQECPARDAIIEFAERPYSQVPDALHEHLRGCPRCAQTFAAFRAAACVAGFPDRFSVALSGIELPTGPGQSEGLQVLGYIDLESLAFHLCDDADDWQANPLCIRVNLVLDEGADFLSLALLDVPPEISSVVLTTPRGSEAMLDVGDGVYEFTRGLEEYVSDEGPRETFSTYLNAGLLQFVFERSADPVGIGLQSVVMDLLIRVGAIERACDYVLPSGLHSDTHVRVGKLCHSEESLRGIANAFNELMSDLKFDVVVASGWRWRRLRGDLRSCVRVREIRLLVSFSAKVILPRGSLGT